MASNVARCFFLLLCLLMIQVCVRGRSIKLDETIPAAEPEKVPISLYYEALCPGCANFVVRKLSPILYNGLIDIIDLKLVPWGNAEVIQPNKSFACQHGPHECMLNTMEACIIDTWPSAYVHFPVISCIKIIAELSKSEEWEFCFQLYELSSKPVMDCYTTGKGFQLEQKYAEETKAQKVPFVPWVVVNGQPLKDDYDDFVKYMCKAYKGTLPRQCTDALYGSSLRKENSFQNRSVCYTDKNA